MEGCFLRGLQDLSVGGGNTGRAGLVGSRTDTAWNARTGEGIGDWEGVHAVRGLCLHKR